MPKAAFQNDQQRYLWSLVRQAGWDKAVPDHSHSRFDAYLLKTFNVTHLNALNEKQLRQSIATLKPYAAKARHEAKKKLHKNIMAYIAKHGQDINWLHYNMELWGFGDSLRECSYNDCKTIYALVKKALG
ncbi:MAG: DUF1018 domain-containing protein [Candidatus Cloacimonetes bacterium]|jgi:hypothetical protein